MRVIDEDRSLALARRAQAVLKLRMSKPKQRRKFYRKRRSNSGKTKEVFSQPSKFEDNSSTSSSSISISSSSSSSILSSSCSSSSISSSSDSESDDNKIPIHPMMRTQRILKIHSLQSSKSKPKKHNGSSMFKEMSDRRSFGTSEGLTKNSTISCTVDDLREGLVVVSFTHEDNLFQGVLLQLNRERGIPAGISFPKDFFSGEGKKETEKDPSQIPPINQRHTYFQDTCNGSQSRSLRRIIKPPARYRNSRMSLRPVQRPVLCAKCGIRCEDKTLSQTTTSSSTEKSDNKSKRNNSNGVNVKKIHTKVSKSEQTQSTISNSRTAGGIVPILPIVEDPKDFNYESIGSHGIVDNAWRRPLAKPLKNQIKLSSSTKSSSELNHNKVTSNGGGKQLLKSVPNTSISSTMVSSTSDKIPSSLSSNFSTFGSCINENVEKSPEKNKQTDLLSCQSQIPTPVFRITKVPTRKSGSLKVTEKVNNLKLCISKLTSKQPQLDVHCDSILVDQTLGSSESNAKESKPRSRRRATTVPMRFLDSHYQPDSKKRKLSGDCLKDSSYCVTSVSALNDTPNQVNSNIIEEGPKQKNIEILSSFSASSISSSFGNVSSNYKTSSDVFEVNKKMQPNTSINKPLEPAKTPVIKITFGSSGNGKVVQILPKATHQEEENIFESKAARKAMKKAKREAKKKELESKEALNTETAALPLTLKSNISQSESSVLNNENPGLPNLVCEESESRIASDESLPTEGLEAPNPKRRKKDKKKKRTKTHYGKVISSPIECIKFQELPSSSPNLIDEEPITSTSKTPEFLDFFERKPLVENSSLSGDLNPNAAPYKTQTEAHQRLCISLKRLNTNAYIPLNNTLSNDELDTLPESTENDEPHDSPDAGILSDDKTDNLSHEASLLDQYHHEGTNKTYKRGDIVWGKSLGCPWWPGKIMAIVSRDGDDVRAKVAWYQSTLKSLITFTELHPFEEYFETKYTRSRRKAFYQQAVREALIDAHQLTLEDLSND